MFLTPHAFGTELEVTLLESRQDLEVESYGIPVLARTVVRFVTSSVVSIQCAPDRQIPSASIQRYRTEYALRMRCGKMV